jgi:hypothetical protein
MKRISIIILLTAGIGGSLWAEIRFDLGFDLLFTQNSRSGEEDDNVLFSGDFKPLPELGLYAQFNVGILHFGGGIRGFSYFLYSGFWPSIYLEANIAKITLHASAGGFVYGILDFIGDGCTMEYDEDNSSVHSVAQVLLHKSIIPEISLWFRIGKVFRIGGGGILILSFEEDRENVFDVDPRFYLGMKFSFPSERRRMNPNGTQRFF